MTKTEAAQEPTSNATTESQQTSSTLPLKERFQLLRQLPGGLQRRQYLAKDRQTDRYVLISLAKWEQEAELEREFSISQQLHGTHLSKHIVQCHELFKGNEAFDSLADLDGDTLHKLSHTHCTELVLVAEFISAFGRPEQAAETLHHVQRLLHVEGASLPSGEPLRSAPQGAFLYELIGRELVMTLEELNRAQVVHADLHPKKLALCIDPSALLTGFREGQQQTFIKANDLSTALQMGDPVQVTKRDLPYQSPQRLGALLGGDGKPYTARCEDDIFSMGAILYTLLTGSPPYATSNELPWFDRARNLHEQWHKTKAPPPLTHEWIEQDILRAIESMCAFSPEDRPNASSLMQAFSRPWSKTARRFSNQLFAAPASTLHNWLDQIRSMPSLLRELKRESLQPFPPILQSLPEWMLHATETLEDLVTEATEDQHQQDAQLRDALSEIKALKEQVTTLELATQTQETKDVSATREALMAEVRQEAFEEAYQEAYKKAQEESMQRADDLLMIRSQPSHPMQTQNVMTVDFDPSQIDELQENLLQLKQEYTQLNALFMMEQEQTQLAMEGLMSSMDERDSKERSELVDLQKEIDATRLELNQRLQALQAEEELLQASLSQINDRLGLREAIRQGELTLDLEEEVEEYNRENQHYDEDPMDGFAPPIERTMPPTNPEIVLGVEPQPPVNTAIDISAPPMDDKDKVLMPVYRSTPAKLSKPPSKLMMTAPLDLLDEIGSSDEHFKAYGGPIEDDDDVQVIVGTPAEPSKIDLPAPQVNRQQSSMQLGQRILKEPSIGRLPSALQQDLMTFFGQLEQVDWFSGGGDPSHVYNLMQQHLRRLEPFAKAMGQPRPRLIAMFRSGTHKMHSLMASAETLNARVERVFEASLSNQPDNWSGAGQDVWSCLKEFQIPPGSPRFDASHWMVPWDMACDTILETTWIAANDVAWSVARDAPRFAASDAASDAANELQRSAARSAVWSITWEFVRFAAAGSLWSASSNAASDIANDVAWRLVQDKMTDRDLLNPFSPLFRVWAAGWWPIHLASGDSILWAPLQDSHASEIIWEMERGDFRS